MKLLDLFAALSWLDAVDFALLAGIFYGLLRLLHGTRAIPVLAGFGMVSALAFVAEQFQLVAVATVLRYFLQYAILILIVVFHQELRRILVRLGQQIMPWSLRSILSALRPAPPDAELALALRELLAGIDRLTRAKAGVLIVIERQVSVLDHCSDVGRVIDASLRADTLVALALPHRNNPAHDGAILIQDGRLARAGVICPLAENVEDLHFGTRHRGALGISEATDAVVVVLSEERNEVRIAIAGTISEPLTRSEVERVLENEVQSRPSDDAEPRFPESLPEAARTGGWRAAESTASGTVATNAERREV
jgi:uncharacterized protein (TIGR00159 family)